MAINPALITTIRVGELPIGDIELTSKIGVENGTDLQQVTGQDLIDFVNINATGFQFEIKDLWVSQAYIDDNFDGTGLGVSLCEGYAICNGQNGTPNLDGLVSVGYGNNYNVIKAIGGSKNAVVVEHNHYTVVSGSETSNNDNSLWDGSNAGRKDLGLTSKAFGQSIDPFDYELTTSAGNIDGGKTNSVGETGINKNMQPYMVLLKIMKL
jgi:hypothetical protein